MRYTIGDLIGTGSFGRVHEAHDAAGRKYAAKVVDAGDEVGLCLLRAQYRLLSAADHPRVVTVYDLVEDGDGAPHLVMEYLDGLSLADHVRKAGLESLPGLAIRILDGLRHIHSLGGMHGDLKPDNIVVCGGENGHDVKLVDVGFDNAAGEKLPRIQGTLPYLAPEVIRSDPADGRSDLYSLGVVLYEALTGACPFGGNSPREIMNRHLEFTPPPPGVVSGDVDNAWDDLVMRLLSKEPTQRFPDATAAAFEIGRAFGDIDLVARNLAPPRTLAHLWDMNGGLVEEAILSKPGRAVMVGGGRHAGVASVLRNVGARLKSRGAGVISVTLGDSDPLSAQVVRSLAGHGAGRREARGDLPTRVSNPELFSLDSLLADYDLSLDRRHAIIIRAASEIDGAGLRAMSELAAANSDLITVVIGLESERGVADGPVAEAGVEFVPMATLMSEGIADILRRQFGVTSVPAELLEALVGNTRGSALLLEETLADLWRSGDLGYKISNDVLELEWTSRAALPDSLKQVIENKVGELDENAVRVAGLLALAGGSLERSIIAEAGNRHGWEPYISELVERDLVDDAGAGMLRFNHAVTRGVILERLSPQWAKETAVRLAGEVDKAGIGPADSYRIGSLYQIGGRPADALPHLLRAGDYFARFSVMDATLAYGRALDCAAEGKERAEIEEKLGDLKLVESDFDSARDHYERASGYRPEAARKRAWVAALDGKYEEAEEMLKECERAAEKRGDEIELARVRVDLAYVYAARGKIEESLGVVSGARRFFEERQMASEAGLAAYREGITRMRAGKYGAATSAWQAAVSHFEAAGDRRMAAQSLQAIGYAGRKQMDYQRAKQNLKRSLEIYSDLKGLSTMASASNTYSLVLLEMGDLVGSREFAREALEFNMMAGLKRGVVLARMLAALIELEAGNWRIAENALSEAQGGIPPEDLYLKAQLQRYLAMAKIISGDRDGALALIKESHSSARLAGDEEGKYQALLEKAVALLRFGDAGEAAEAAREALVGFSTETSLLLTARAQALLGEALCADGKVDEGFEKLEAARANLLPVSRSQHMGRVFKALARASYLRRDHATFSKYLDEALEILRAAGARYDFADALYLGGVEAMQRGGFLRARHYFAEAARIFESLEIDDLREKVVRAMEAVPSGEIEVKAVHSLSRISQALISKQDLDSVLNVAMDLAMDYLGADRGVLMLATGSDGDMVTVAERKMDEESLREVADISKSIVESVRSTGEPVIATDLMDDPRFKDSQSIRTHNIMSVMCLPLMRDRRLLGLLYLDTRGIPTKFSDLEKAFVEAFANQVSLATENARTLGDLRISIDNMKARAGERYRYSNIIGPGRAMQEVFRQVEKAAPSDTNILLRGENGTGKDLIAGLIHELSPRKDGPFIEVNCPAIAKDLVESELFGIEKSVATGVAPRSGFFERANGGTIFLNEIGDVPLATQVRILSVIDKKEFERVGGTRVIKADVRVITATNRDLKHLITKGAFREDLYYRINHIQIGLPPLRERMEDLDDLIAHFIKDFAAKNSKSLKRVSEEAHNILRAYSWPGNVRELERCIERAVVFSDGNEILITDLPEEVVKGARTGQRSVKGRTLPEIVADIEKSVITEELGRTNWNKSRAARNLGIHEATLRKKIKIHGIAKSPN